MKTSPGLNILLAAVLLCSIAATMSSSQETSTGPSFEVASIKPNPSAREIGGPWTEKVDYFAWNGRTLKTLITTAYRVRNWQVEGGPDWINSQLWDVEARAKAENAGAVSKPGDRSAQHSRLMQMLQSLLEDRFKLKVQRQTRESPVYNLVVAKGGPKIKLDEDQSPPTPQGLPAVPSSWANPEVKRGQLVEGFAPMGGYIEGRAVPIDRLVSIIRSRADRPLNDGTNLKGLYNISMKWSEEASGPGDSPLVRRSPSIGPALMAALQEQLGLRLESAKGPVEFLVVISAQKPSGN